MMKIIFDRVPHPRKFPLAELLQAVRETIPCLPATPVTITRLGGLGDAVWKYESQLDEGRDVTVEFQVLENIALNPGAYIDELHCILDSVQFGIFDTTWMFVQSPNRAIESAIALKFRDVRDSPDWPTPI